MQKYKNEIEVYCLNTSQYVLTSMAQIIHKIWQTGIWLPTIKNMYKVPIYYPTPTLTVSGYNHIGSLSALLSVQDTEADSHGNITLSWEKLDLAAMLSTLLSLM